MKKLTTIICAAVLLGYSAAISCKKEAETVSIRDQLVGRWLDADSVGSKDYDVFNADGTGIDTRVTGTAGSKDYTFTWSVNGQTLTIAITNTTNGFCNIDGISTINIISPNKVTVTDQTTSSHYITTLIRQ